MKLNKQKSIKHLQCNPINSTTKRTNVNDLKLYTLSEEKKKLLVDLVLDLY